MGAAKELLAAAPASSGLLDPGRELEIVEGEPDPADGATISITHTLVELVLSDTTGATASAILPDLDVFLEQIAGFPRSLRAAAAVGRGRSDRLQDHRRTYGAEVADRSNHGSGEVLRLLAALVVTGILEPETPLHISDDVDLLPAEELTDGSKRRIPVSWILGAAAALFIVLAVILFIMIRSSDPEPVQGVASEQQI